MEGFEILDFLKDQFRIDTDLIEVKLAGLCDAVIVDEYPDGSDGPGNVHDSRIVTIPSQARVIASLVGVEFFIENKRGRNHHLDIGFRYNGQTATIRADMSHNTRRGKCRDKAVVKALKRLGFKARS